MHKKRNLIFLNMILILCSLIMAACSSLAGETIGTPPADMETTDAAAQTASPDAETEAEPLPESATETSEETAPSGPVLEIEGKTLEGQVPSDEQFTTILPVIEDTLREYALFFIYMGFDLEDHVDPESHLHDYLFGSDTYSRIYNEFYNYEYIDSYSFSEFDVSDPLIFEDEYLTVNVRYKLNIEFSRPEDMADDNQKLDALWTFRKIGEDWKLFDSGNNNIYARENDSGDSGVSILEIRGKDYDGVLMILNDASRLFCATVPYFAYDYGQTVPEMIGSYEEMGYVLSGGINGGNFDDGGTGSSYTAMPIGAVISEGEAVFSEHGPDETYHLTGFTEKGELILGNMSVNEALELGIRDAVHTTEKDGPFMIIDGVIRHDQLTDPSVYGAGTNPRTAIGQRADGSVMLLVVNGRQPSSLGASFEDLAQIMLDFGAVTASAMDGGTSSQMIWNGNVLNQPFSAFGLRMCPTAWLIKDHSS